MKILRPLIFVIFSLTLLSSSCKKQVVQPVSELSKLPPATQTGARTFGCLVNGHAFVPQNNLRLLQGPTMQCNYIYLSRGFYFNVSAGANDGNGNPVGMVIQTDS